MKPNIVIVGFDYQFNKAFSKYIADKLDMFFVDTSELIEYNLINSKEALLKCGQEYIDKEERKTIMGVAEYENAVINIEYDSFANNYKYFGENNLKVYIASKNVSVIDEIVIEERKKFLKALCDLKIEINCSRMEEAYKQLIKGLRELQ